MILKFRPNIQNKLTLLLVGVSLITVLASSILAIRTIIAARRVNVTELLKQLNQYQADTIDKFINDKFETFRINIVDPGIGRVTKEQGDFILKTLLAENPSIFEATFIDTDGNEIIKHSTTRVFRDEELVNQKSQPKFQFPSEKKDYVSDVYFTPSGPAVTIASPVVNQENQLIAVLTGEMLFEPVKTSIEKIALGKDGYFIFIDQVTGKVLYSSKPAIIKQGQTFANDPIVKKLSNGEIVFAPDSAYRNAIDERVIGAGQKLKALQAIALSEWPTGDAFSVVRSVILQVIIALLIVAAIIAIIARKLAARVVKPLETLKIGAAQIGKGQFGHQIEVHTGDEIEELAVDFNVMSTKLKQTVAELIEEQKKVAQAKDEFVFIAAHELRSPVTVIKGYLDMVKDQTKKMTKEFQESFAQIAAANDRLVQLVQDLLQVARSEAGRLEIKVSPNSEIVNITKELVDQYNLKVKQAKVELSTSLPTSKPEVMVDIDRFKEILGNLVDNAIKYNRPGGKVNVTQAVKAGFLETAVADTGFGMTAENLKKLFTKFYRAKEKGTESIPGTGLGLWITKELIQRMGGKIDVSSQLGKGSTFKFTIPLRH